MPDLAPEALHNHLLERAPRILRFDPDAYLPEWQSAARRSFKQLLGLMPGKVDPDVRTLAEHAPTADRPYHRIEFLFTSEPRVDVPCDLRIPSQGTAPFPTVIFLADNAEAAEPFAAEALRRGHAVLLFPLRGNGARRAPTNAPDPALVALLVGRTLLGERVWDVLRAIDVLAENIPAIDASRLSVLGIGDAGLIAYAAAAIEPRLAAVAALGAIEPLAALAHAPADSARYLPNILHYFDLADLAGLIAPRPLLVASESPALLAEIRDIYTAFKTPSTFATLPPNASPAQLFNQIQN